MLLYSDNFDSCADYNFLYWCVSREKDLNEYWLNHKEAMLRRLSREWVINCLIFRCLNPVDVLKDKCR